MQPVTVTGDAISHPVCANVMFYFSKLFKERVAIVQVPDCCEQQYYQRTFRAFLAR
jgi:hypothetical protein